MWCHSGRNTPILETTKCVKNQTQDRFQNWKPGFNWYCSTVIILKGIVWSNTCNVSTHSSLSYRIIGLSFCIEQYIQCEINTFTQMDIIVGAHLYDTRHKNIQVIVFFFPLLMWSTSKIYGHVLINTTGSSLIHNSYIWFLSKCVNLLCPLDIFFIFANFDCRVRCSTSGSYIWGLNTTKRLNTVEL